MKLIEKIQGDYYTRCAKRGKNAKKILERGKEEEVYMLYQSMESNEVKLLLYQLPSELKEKAEKLLYKTCWNDCRLNCAVVDFLFKHGSPQEIQRGIVEGIVPFYYLEDLERRELILLSLSCGHIRDKESCTRYLLKTKDKEGLEAFLKSVEGEVPDKIVDLAIEFGYLKLLAEKRISERKMRQIIEGENKEAIMTLLPKMSSVGVGLVLENKKIDLTPEERQKIESLAKNKAREEDAWRSIDAEFNMIR